MMRINLKTIAGILLMPAILYVYWLGHIIHLQEERSALIAAIWQHVGYGVLLAIPVIAYFLLPSTQVRQSANLIKTLFKVSYGIFISTIILLLMTGPLIVWSRGSTLKVFSWIKIPSPVEKMPKTYEFLEQTHGVIADLFIFALIGFAILAVIAYLIKDQSSD